MPARVLAFAVLLAVLSGCSKNEGNPFASHGSKPAPDDAVLMFLSGSWASEPGQPRELFSANADGSEVQQLSACRTSSPPCDFVAFAISPDRTRIAAVRASVGGAPGASALYFMDLGRSVEQMLFDTKRVAAVDWAHNGTSLIYQSSGAQVSDDDDLYLCNPDGTQDTQLTQATAGAPIVRERNPRFDPYSQTAVYERIEGSGPSRIYFYKAVPVTSGPASGPALSGTPYLVGGDADPVISPDATRVLFRRLTGNGNGGLGTWDLISVKTDGSDPVPLATGPAFRGAPDWGLRGIVFVEIDVAADEARLVVVQPDGSGRTVLRSERAGFGMTAPRWIPGA